MSSVCDLLKCKAINHLVPWLTSSSTVAWMMHSRNDSMRKLASHLWIWATFQPHLIALFVTMPDFGLAYVNFPQHNQNQSTETSLCNAILSEEPWENFWSELGCTVWHVCAQTTYYPTFTFKLSTHIQLLWDVLKLLNPFCNHYGGILLHPNMGWSKG